MKFAVSSSDARNIKTSIKMEGDEIVINGHKWCVSTSFSETDIIQIVIETGGYREQAIRVPSFTLLWERVTLTMRTCTSNKVLS